MTEDKKDFALSDFLNGLFVGSFLGAAYVYFFHHPQGKKIFQKYWQQRDEIWQEIKKELAKEEKEIKKTTKPSRTTNTLSYWQKEVEAGVRFFKEGKSKKK